MGVESIPQYGPGLDQGVPSSAGGQCRVAEREQAPAGQAFPQDHVAGAPTGKTLADTTAHELRQPRRVRATQGW